MISRLLRRLAGRCGALGANRLAAGQRVGLAVTVALLILVASRWPGRRASIGPMPSLGTLTVEFRAGQTDGTRVAALLSELEAEVIAVQDVVAVADFEVEVLPELASRRGRPHGVVWAPPLDDQPGPRHGLIYDRASLELLEVRAYPCLLDERHTSCGMDMATGLMALFEDARGRRFAVLGVRFASRAPELRLVELARTLRLADKLELEFGAKVAVVGNLGTARPSETRVFARRADHWDYQLSTAGLACTGYANRRSGQLALQPVTTGHVLVRAPARSEASALGMCAALGCRRTPVAAMPSDAETVGAHCPVRVRGSW